MTRQPYWWSHMAVFASVLLVGIICIWYANKASEDSSRSICPLVNTLDEAYRETPPPSPAGKKVAANIAELKARLSC